MKRVKLKKKRRPLKVVMFILIVGLAFYFTIMFMIDNSRYLTKEEYINFFIDKMQNKKSDNFIIKEGIKFISKIDAKNPNTLIDTKFESIKSSSVKKIEKDAKANEDDYDASAYEKITSYVQNSQKEKDNPLVYLYNSHQLEAYSSEGLNNIAPNVLMASYLLSEELNKNNVSTIVEDTNISEFIKASNMPSDSFYASTRIFIKNKMNKYNSLRYYIDIHRDSVDKNISTIKINDKDYARVLFVLGLTNPNHSQNEELMNKLDSLLDENYPGLSRGIYKRETPSWPDSYNQDLNGNVILIEIGAKDNTIEEVSNTINALSSVISKALNN